MAQERALSPSRERGDGERTAVSGKAARGELKKFGESLSLLVESAKEVHRAHSATGGAKLAAALAAFGERADLEGVEMNKLYVQAAGALRQVDGCKLTYHLEVGFISPLEKFVRSELKALTEAEKRLTKAREDYDSAQIKTDQSRMKRSDKTSKMEVELAEAQQRFEMAEIHFLNKSLEVDARKQFEVTERVCDLLLAQLVMHKLSYDILKAIEGPLQEAKQKLAETRNNFVSKVAPGRVEEMRTPAPLSRATNSTGANDSKQGYMHLNGKRKWVTVSDGAFTIYKSWKDMNAGAADKEKRDVIDLKICTVKKLEPDAKDKEKDKERFAFTLISPERTLTCDVSESSELDEWLAVIKNGIASSLKKRTANRSASPTPHSPSPFANASSLSSSNTPITTVTFAPVPVQDKATQAALALVRSANSANAQCGDCTAKEPEWAVYNLGVVVCSDCAAVHRSLGTHVSRVRSLTLDHWEAGQLFLLKQFGNAVANEVWEAGLPGEDKVSEIADRAARERFIMAKYVTKKYVPKNAALADDEAKYNALKSAATASDYVGLLKLLAQGADPNRGPLLAVLTQDASVSPHTIEFLLQNNAKAAAADEKGWTALHYAAKVDNAPAAAVLLRYNAPVGQENEDRKTPAAIAAQSSSHAVARMLGSTLSHSVASAEISPRSPKSSSSGSSRSNKAPLEKSLSAPSLVVPQAEQRSSPRHNNPSSPLAAASAPAPAAPTAGGAHPPSSAPTSLPVTSTTASVAPSAATNSTLPPTTSPPATAVPSLPAASAAFAQVPSATVTPASPTPLHVPSTLSSVSQPSASPVSPTPNPRRLVMRDLSPEAKKAPPKPLPGVPPAAQQSTPSPPSPASSTPSVSIVPPSGVASITPLNLAQKELPTPHPHVTSPPPLPSAHNSVVSQPANATTLAASLSHGTGESPRRGWTPYVNHSSPDQIRLTRQKEIITEGVDVLRQRAAALRAELAACHDDAAIAELAKRLHNVRAVLNGDPEHDP